MQIARLFVDKASYLFKGKQYSRAVPQKYFYGKIYIKKIGKIRITQQRYKTASICNRIYED